MRARTSRRFPTSSPTKMSCAARTSFRPDCPAPRAGPIGLCAMRGAKLKGASLIIGVDTNADHLNIASRLGANVVLNTNDGDPVAAIKRLTDGRGVDVAIEALGRQEAFENAL